MDVLFLSFSLSRGAGGILEVECSLAHELKTQGSRVHAVGLEDSDWPQDQHRWTGIPSTVFPVVGLRVFGFAPGMGSYVMNARYDVLHLHSLWTYPSLVALGQKRPYVVSPNGMLDPWARNNSGWKKKLAACLYENRMLRGASCLIANTIKEMQDMRSFGLRNPVAIISNGVVLPDPTFSKTERENPSRKNVLLYLGRIHPKKGLESALKAWAEIQHSKSNIQHSADWQFVIAGWNQGGHVEELEQACRDLSVPFANVPIEELVCGPAPTTPVVFTGIAYGDLKARLMRMAAAFILPSFSEGLPMAVLDAWSYNLPVLMTPDCNLPEGINAGAAILLGKPGTLSTTENLPAAIESGCLALLSMSDAERTAMGFRGRRLVEERFTWSKVAEKMITVYRWVLGGGPRPDCVSLSGSEP